MLDLLSLASAAGASDFRVRVLYDVQLTLEGVAYRSGSDTHLLEWSQIKRAVTAEVGEPEGVRTVVFDLVVSADEGGCEVCRFDADPYDDAMGVARAIQASLEAERVSPSVKSVAVDGISTAWFFDLESFSEATLLEVRGSSS